VSNLVKIRYSSFDYLSNNNGLINSLSHRFKGNFFTLIILELFGGVGDVITHLSYSRYSDFIVNRFFSILRFCFCSFTDVLFH